MSDTPAAPWSAADRVHLAARHVALVAHQVRETMARVPSSVDRHDLHAAGLLALLIAARHVDPTRPAPFADTASIRVRAALVDELRSVDWAIRAVCPRDPEAARARLLAVLAEFPDAPAVAAALEDPECPGAPAVAALRSGAGTSVRERVQCLTVALEELPQRLRHVVHGYFIAQRPMAELAAEVGASEARAVHLRAEGLILLRDALAATTGPDVAEHAGPTPHAQRPPATTRATAGQHATASH